MRVPGYPGYLGINAIMITLDNWSHEEVTLVDSQAEAQGLAESEPQAEVRYRVPGYPGTVPGYGQQSQVASERKRAC
eukprot:2544592-Rhodomonas_salina.1